MSHPLSRTNSLGASNMAKTAWASQYLPERALPFLEISYEPDLSGS